MAPRLDYFAEAPQGAAALRQLESYLDECGLEARLLDMVKIRASQLNGCARCLDMHTKEARANGETEQRLYTLSAWRETPFFSDRERCALAWTEAVTCIAEHRDDEALYAQLQQHFSNKQIVDLTLAIVAINGRNRLAISFHAAVGHFRARARPEAEP